MTDYELERMPLWVYERICQQWREMQELYADMIKENKRRHTHWLWKEVENGNN